MPLPVKLKDVADEMSMQFDDLRSYINRKTGEMVLVEVDLLSLAEEGAEYDGSGANGEEGFEDAKRVIESGDFVRLPEQDGRDEYRLMEEFVEAIEDESLRELLETAISGKGAFRRFKDTINRKGIEQAWYAKRDDALKEVAREFLESEKIAYVNE